MSNSCANGFNDGVEPDMYDIIVEFHPTAFFFATIVLTRRVQNCREILLQDGGAKNCIVTHSMCSGVSCFL